MSTVRKVGERLTAAVESYLKQNNLQSATDGFSWEYNVLVSEELNAWCMPGGQIDFYEGILPVCQDENGIAVVMLTFGVGAQVGVMLPYFRTHESEADELGLYFMAMAGYNPQTAPAFWERMAEKGGSRPPEFLSTHPDPSN